MKSKNVKANFEVSIPTDLGRFVASYSAKGLAGLRFPARAQAAGQARKPRRKIPAQVRRWHRAASRALLQSLAGRQPETLPPLDWSAGTDFQRSVWTVLRRIGPGQTRSYAEVARAIGKPRAARAVGGACGANPIPVLVPCHRVLAAHQQLGGFSGGLNWKRALLQREGVQVQA